MSSRLTDAQVAAQIRAKTAAMRQALEGTRMAVPAAQMGALAGIAPAWEAGKTYEPGTLFSYAGMVGFARQTVTAQETYPPFSAGTEALYGVRPAPDADGVYPYAYNMRAEVGMRVRQDGAVYRCIQAADPLLYPPSQAAALFEAEAGA